jgi:hypothetical protein
VGSPGPQANQRQRWLEFMLCVDGTAGHSGDCVIRPDFAVKKRRTVFCCFRSLAIALPHPAGLLLFFPFFLLP